MDLYNKKKNEFIFKSLSNYKTPQYHTYEIYDHVSNIWIARELIRLLIDSDSLNFYFFFFKYTKTSPTNDVYKKHFFAEIRNALYIFYRHARAVPIYL